MFGKKRADDQKVDQVIAMTAGQMAMDAAKQSILQEAEATGQMWMPRIDGGFISMVRRHYHQHGATSAAVDAVLADVGRDAQQHGQSIGMSWITGFQAIVALEMIAQIDDALTEGSHQLSERFSRRQAESMGN